MKHTKRHVIERKIFTIEDLKRIANIFDELSKTAKKSSHHHSVEYKVLFSDGDSIEADSKELLEDDYCKIKNPIKLEFRFVNYENERKAIFSIAHGVTSYGNEFIVSAKESKWVNDIYSRLSENVAGAKPQNSWISKHPALLTSAIALGIGSLGMLLIGVINQLIFPSNLIISEGTREGIKSLALIVIQFKYMFYILYLFFKLVAGMAWGAFPLSRWILNSWPNIELDFGAEHLKIEKTKRAKIFIALTTIIIPITLDLIQELILSAI